MFWRKVFNKIVGAYAAFWFEALLQAKAAAGANGVNPLHSVEECVARTRDMLVTCHEMNGETEF